MFETLVYPSTARVLEIGCGVGQYAAWVSRQVPHGEVLGVDLDPSALQRARLYFPARDFPNLRFLQADARELNFSADAFDYVVSSACLHYLDHPGQAFTAISRHLKPGGRFCLSCLGRDNLRTLYRSLQDVMARPDWAAYFVGLERPGALVDPSSCDPWLQNAGLIKKRARLYNDPISFPNREMLLNWLEANFDYYSFQVPSPLRRDFLHAVLSAYCRKLPSDKPIRVYRTWLQIEAIKSH